MKTNNKKELWLVWKEPTTRERFVIGLLSFADNVYYFRYLENEGDNNLNNALKNGFSLLPAFSERTNIYRSDELFYPFLNRLPSRKRRDVKKLFESIGLSSECSDYEFLKATGGRLPTDTLEFLEPIYIDSEGNFNITFYVTGTRYYDLLKMIDKIKISTELKMELQHDNKFDPHAIVIFTLNNEKLGYVPVFYTAYLNCYVTDEIAKVYVVDINKDVEYNEMLKVTVERNNGK